MELPRNSYIVKNGHKIIFLLKTQCNSHTKVIIVKILVIFCILDLIYYLESLQNSKYYNNLISA